MERGVEPPTKRPCTAREDLDVPTNFLGLSDDFRVFLPVFLGSGRLRGDSGKVRGGPGSRGKVWEQVLEKVREGWGKFEKV